MATVTRENIGLLNDKITVKLAKEDYLPSFEKALKNYSKQANIPGFRKGMVPSGLIRKMHGQNVFVDEVLRSVEKQLTDYMTNEKLEIFAQPLPMPENDSRQLDMNSPNEYAFAFEIGLKPDFKVADLKTAKLPYYKITVTEEMVDEELNRLQLRYGNMTEPETVTGDDNVLNISFTELGDDGQPVEGGITKDNSVLVKYFAEAFRPRLIGKKTGDALETTLAEAFDTKEREWILGDLGLSKEDPAQLSRKFRLTITKVGLVEKAAMDENFFQTAFPGKEITDEASVRNAIKEDIQLQLDAQSRNQLFDGIYHHLLDHTTISFPESFLKKWIQNGNDSQKSPEEAEKEYPSFSNSLKWTLIVDQLVKDNQIEVKPEDLRDFAKAQLFSYMGNMQMGQLDTEQPWVNDYVERMMKDRKFVEDSFHRIQTDKVFGLAESQVQRDEKPIDLESFQKMQAEHHHHH
ncbi:trigger factor [Flavihumibacter petaseus]|uniref:Putative trigger factor n=1 Tax=Flavihumibacter petaseus NBRC 106054 TaxID=1220578 RepID=A0A0E9N5Q8_9BACT|nr:trigger factor [Flavihumibacter petaseus]GAO45021.1 putative trigger factor [Flavihumibacter petaseus NBRC 106054]